MPEIEQFDAVIIGGGINGCGTFRDLCLQGLKVLLLEREDFCAGASQASSRLMHGGLKYLETGEFRLVRESLTERNMLLATAPHYVQPLECLVPVRSTFGGILGSAGRFLRLKTTLKDRGFLITALGLTLYDIYGRTLQAMPGHQMLTRGALRRQFPRLSRRLTGAGVYFEAHVTHAERLGLELVLDGEAASPGSQALNHADVLGAEAGVIRFSHGGAHRAVRARSIVNAGGAWIDKVNASLGLPTRLMGGSKGSHLVLRHPELLAALRGRMIYFGTPDGRVNLVYPFADHVLVGATDIAHPDPDSATCDAHEAAYLCRAVAEVFPDLPVTPAHVVARFCGTRPLPRAEGPIGQVSRDHSLAELKMPGSETPVHCLIGGKWTTFRAFAELAADRVLGDLGHARRVRTHGLPIGGGRGFPRDSATRAQVLADLAQAAGVDQARAAVLLSRYGMRAFGFAEALSAGPERMLAGLPDYSAQELSHIAATERVASLDDLLRRRTLIALQGRDTPAVRSELAALLPRLALEQRHIA